MKTKQISLFAGMFLLIQAIFAQIPAGYYDNAIGTGATLKNQLYNIIKGHTSVSYDQLWTSYYTSDRRSDGKIWDIYSDNCNFTYSTDQCGNYDNVCDCYNREHSFPKSWFNDASPMVSDIFHIYPTDGKVNGMRSNYPFGNASGGAIWGNGKLGTCTYPGYTGIVFEPADQYKGDLARTYFYMATRYENIISGWESNDSNGDAMLDGTNFPCFEPWALALLISWHNLDPVSQKEIDRNNAIYTSIQHNRNPYIDHPEWVNTVWGTGTAVSQGQEIPLVSYYPNPVENKLTIDLSSTTVLPELIWISDVTGKFLIQTKPIESKMDIDMTSFSRGVYFLNISSKQSKTTYKLIH